MTFLRPYVAAAALTAAAVMDLVHASGWSVAAIALMAPIGPVLVSYLLTRSKLKKQDERVQEIHVMVNSNLTKTVEALSAALQREIELKDRIGIPVSQGERDTAENPADLEELNRQVKR